jgi:hypothetical protein
MNRILDFLRDDEEDEDENIQHCLGGLYKLYLKLYFYFLLTNLRHSALSMSNKFIIYPHIIPRNLWIKQCSGKIIGLTYLKKA